MNTKKWLEVKLSKLYSQEQLEYMQEVMERDCDKNIDQIIAAIGAMICRDCEHTKALMKTLKCIISDYEKDIRI